MSIMATFAKYLPIIQWLPEYSLTKCLQDCLAGLTVGLLAIPQGIAFATIAGLPPQHGLYSAFLCSFVYIFLGSVDPLVIGPTTLMALMSEPLTSQNVGYAPLLSLINGAAILACGIFRLGFLIDFVSTPVTSGFTTAASVTIASSQLKNLIGIRGNSSQIKLPGILKTYEHLYSNIQTAYWPDAVLGLVCLIVLLSLKYVTALMPVSSLKLKRSIWLISISKNVFVVIFCTTISYFIETPFTLTGEIAPGLPASLSLPNYGIDTILPSVASIALAQSLVNVLNHVAVCKSFASSSGKSVNATQELLALGTANILGSFVWAMPVSASFNRTSVNSASGIQTPLGGFITGLVVLAALLFMMPFCAFIPKATLAAVVINAVIFNVDLSIFMKLWKTTKMDLMPLCATLFGCLFWRLEYGIVLGICASLFDVLKAIARPKLEFYVEDDHLRICLESGLFYPAANYFKDTIETYVHKHQENFPIILDLSKVNSLDFTSMMIIDSLLKALEKMGKPVAAIIGLEIKYKKMMEKMYFHGLCFCQKGL